MEHYPFEDSNRYIGLHTCLQFLLQRESDQNCSKNNRHIEVPEKKILLQGIIDFACYYRIKRLRLFEKQNYI